jgi:hypothetical protein
MRARMEEITFAQIRSVLLWKQCVRLSEKGVVQCGMGRGWFQRSSPNRQGPNASGYESVSKDCAARGLIQVASVTLSVRKII